LASTSGDCYLKIWDFNDKKSVQTIKAHDYEILTCDWNKYNEFEIITGAVDRTIRIWDTRNPSKPTKQLEGHEFAVRRLKCSPHSPRTIISASYDMSLCVWDTQKEDSLVKKYDHHTEFVLGLDFNLFKENLIASCSWDETVSVFNIADEDSFSMSRLAASIVGSKEGKSKTQSSVPDSNSATAAGTSVAATSS